MTLIVQLDVSIAGDGSKFDDLYLCANREDAEQHFDMVVRDYPHRPVRIIDRRVIETVVKRTEP